MKRTQVVVTLNRLKPRDQRFLAALRYAKGLVFVVNVRRTRTTAQLVLEPADHRM